MGLVKALLARYWERWITEYGKPTQEGKAEREELEGMLRDMVNATPRSPFAMIAVGFVGGFNMGMQFDLDLTQTGGRKA